MGAFTNKHPVELATLIGQAIANGASTAQVHRDLIAGTFNGWNGPYEMPLETVRAYGKKERAKRAAKTITPEVRDNPKKVVDDLARLLLSKAQRGAEAVGNNDPKALKDWGDAIKTISALVSDAASTRTTGRRNAKAPSDPLTQRLTSPSPVDAIETDEAQGEAPPDEPTERYAPWQPATTTTPHHGGVPAQASIGPVS